MNRITISLIFFIVISMVLPISAIMYASGQTDDNSGSSSTSDSGLLQRIIMTAHQLVG